MPRLSASAGKRVIEFRHKTRFAVALRHNSGSDKRLLLHSRLRAERTGQIMQVAHLVALILRKGDGFATWILFPSAVRRANQASLYPQSNV